MRKNYLILFAAFLVFSFSMSFAQEKPEVKNETKEETVKKVEVQKVDENSVVESKEILNTICPVSDEEADPQITYDYKGKTYSLCCKKCLRKFKKDPEKYISRLEKKEKTSEQEN